MSIALNLDFIAPFCHNRISICDKYSRNKEHMWRFSFHVDQSRSAFLLRDFFSLLTSIIKFCCYVSMDFHVRWIIEIEFRLIHSRNLATLGGRERKEDSRNRERKSGRKEKVNQELVPYRHDLSQWCGGWCNGWGRPRPPDVPASPRSWACPDLSGWPVVAADSDRFS